MTVDQDANAGTDAVVIQIAGDNNHVAVGAAKLHLTRFESDRVAEGDALSGAALVTAYAQGIPLLGREESLQDLWAWLDGPKPVSVRVLVGPGGRGKTRLALTLCQEAVEQGWQAGFLREGEIRRFQGQKNLSAWKRRYPTLIVIDYAAGVAEVIKDWLVELADAPRDNPPLRILLLERSATAGQGWWQLAFGIGGGDADRVARLLDPAEPVTLPEIAALDVRRRILAATLARAGSDLLPPEPGRDTDFDRRLRETGWAGEPLFLMMAAELARNAKLAQVLALPRSDIAFSIADKERERIGRIMKSRGIPDAFGRHLAAMATLCQGLNRDAGFAAIEREKAALGFDAAGDRARLYDALRTALPDDREQIAPILPDIVGEAFLLREWPTDGAAAILRAVEGHRSQVVQTVIRTCQDYAIQGHATPLAWLDALGELLSTELPTLLELLAALPDETVELRERALSLTEAAVVLLRAQLARQDAEPIRALLAGNLNNLSIRLSELGRREDALAACEEAVAIRRVLAQARPDAFRPDLAGSLNNLSNHLSELGRLEEALAACEEAVAIRRVLAEARPDAFRPDLAGSLNNLSVHLSELGRLEDALAACEEAVAIRHVLAQARPDAFRHDLAGSLSRLSGCLSGLGRLEDALAACEEAVAIYHVLAEARPDAFRPNLAMSLNNLSNRLSDLGRREEALAACEEAVGLYRVLAQARPDAFRPDLATSLNNRSVHLSALGRLEDALAACEEAVDLYRALVQARPNAFLPALAASLNNLSNRLSALRRREDALATIKETVDLYRALAQARPDAFRPDLAMSLNNLSGCLSDVGRLEDALAASEEAVAIYRVLAEARPDAFRPDLAGSLNNLSNRLSALGRREDALAACEKAVELYRVLAEARPDAFLPGLAGSLNNLSIRLSGLGRHEDALAACQEAVGVYRVLVQARPDSVRPVLARSLGTLGIILMAQGQPVKAAAAFEESLTQLLPVLRAYPTGVAKLAVGLQQGYLQSCQAAGSEPDWDMLAPVLEILVQCGALPLPTNADEPRDAGEGA